jgi:transcriptional regulator with XRE-family HTH domain
MDTIGKRIARHRLILGISRPELARRVSAQIGKTPPLTGEAIRRYEIEKDNPGNDVRKGLAGVFGTSEQYIEFGNSSSKDASTDAEKMWAAYLKAPEHERRMIDILLKNYMKKPR